VNISRHEPGETRRVTVLDVIRTGRSMFVIAQDEDRPGEAHVCAYRDGFVEAAPGDRGVLIFTAGGPTGGYWHFVREPS